jgi:adenine-specific DNA-methyltransferase
MSKLELDELKTKLGEIFQLDRSELDFGIYRVMRMKTDAVNKYMNEELPNSVKLAFAGGLESKRKTLENDLEKARESARAAGFDPETAPKVIEISQNLKNLEKGVVGNETLVYDLLLKFFSRYYDDGDFISQPRDKGGAYSIPYNGEEVVLHWANKDQYYIKSGENFSNYAFTVDIGGKRGNVRFEVVAADVEKDNTKTADSKKKKYYVLAKKPTKKVINDDGDEEILKLDPIELKDKELIVRFEHKLLEGKSSQKTHDDETAKKILESLSEPWKTPLNTTIIVNDKMMTVLEKNLSTFTAKNSADYFIHKNLRGFLRRELDFFIKNEVVNLDDVENADANMLANKIELVKCLRTIAHDLIDFMAQIEDFQKKLWLKKKFVVETNYCITLDRVPGELYPEIVKKAEEKIECHDGEFRNQREEWIKLFAIDEITGKEADSETKKNGKQKKGEDDDSLPGMGKAKSPKYSKPISVDFLKANPFLVLDTKFFGEEFKWKLISSIPDFDEKCDGFLINSENVQALNLLQARYREQVKCIYIDPPYNTGKDGFIYKDSYQTSSWISSIDCGLNSVFPILTEDSLLFVSNDDNENENLKKILKLNGYLVKTNLVWNTEGHTDNQFEIKVNHEYITLAQKSSHADYGQVIDPNTREESNLWKNIAENSITKNGPANPFSDVILPVGFPVNKESGTIEKDVPVSGFYSELGSLPYFPRKLIKKYSVSFPIKYNSSQYKDFRLCNELKVSAGWANLKKLNRFIQNGCTLLKDDDGEMAFHLTENGTIYYKKTKESARNIVSVLRKFTTTEKMKYELEDMGVEFSYPKPKDLISYILKIGNSSNYLDYYAGSGTTGHAVINLNREDNEKDPGSGRRKYILVEVEKYFDSVMKPRIQKVVYSKDWEDGTPDSRDTGISHCFKYVKLESYEDTLNNLKFEPNENIEKLNGKVRRDYLLNYMMDFESRDSLIRIDDFVKPFDYELEISKGMAGDHERRKIDLVETFNYLVGIKVAKYAVSKSGSCIVSAEKLNGEKVAVVWRKSTVEYAKSKESATLYGLDQLKADYGEAELPDILYINGDHCLPTEIPVGKTARTCRVFRTEPEFLGRMFKEA